MRRLTGKRSRFAKNAGDYLREMLRKHSVKSRVHFDALQNNAHDLSGVFCTQVPTDFLYNNVTKLKREVIEQLQSAFYLQSLNRLHERSNENNIALTQKCCGSNSAM